MIQTVALCGSFGLGIVFALIGAFKLQIAKVLNIDDAKVGGLISALMFTSVIMVLIVGVLVDAWGHKPLAIIGFIVVAACIVFFVSTKSYKMAVLACIFLAVGGMCLNTVANTLMPIVLFGGENPPAASNLGNIAFGFGAFITPFLVGILLRKLGFHGTGYVIALIAFIPIIFALIATYPVVPTGFQISDALSLLAKGIIITASLALFCYIALEVSMGGWISTYLSDVGFEPRGANIVLSIFWVGLMAGRLIAAGFGVKPIVTPELGVAPIVVLSIVAVVTILLMIIAKSKPLAAFAVILTGLVFGPIFPTIVGVMFTKIESALYGSAFGISFAIGLLGGSTIPAAIGIYSKGKTIQKSLVIAMITAFVLFIIAIIMGQF